MMKSVGQLNTGLLVLLYVPILIFTPLYTYHMAVTHHQEKKYPAATVTATACHYPQDIVFRYTMLIATSILALIFYLLFRWLKATARDIQYPYKLPNYLFYLAEFSILLYSITIGTIDEDGTGPLHGPCAVAFFVILVICIIQLTIVITHMRSWDTRAMGYWSLKAKQLLALYVAGVWIRCVIGLLFYSVEEWEGKGDKYVVIVEWNTVIFCLMWVLSFAQEWKTVNMGLFAPQVSEIVDI